VFWKIFYLIYSTIMNIFLIRGSTPYLSLIKFSAGSINLFQNYSTIFLPRGTTRNNKLAGRSRKPAWFLCGVVIRRGNATPNIINISYMYHVTFFLFLLLHHFVYILYMHHTPKMLMLFLQVLFQFQFHILDHFDFYIRKYLL